VWSQRPDGEAEVFARVEPLMTSTNPDDWLGEDVQRDLQNLVEDFPDGPHAEQAKKWLDDVQLELAARQFEKLKLVRAGYTPESEAEKLYVQAQQYERVGDRYGAIQIYDSMNTVLGSETAIETRAVLMLARRNAQRLRDQGGAAGSSADFITKTIADGDELYRKSNRVAANEKWHSIVNLYRDKPEFAPLVEQAQARLVDPERALAEAEPAPDAPSDPAPESPQ
jgi:hypothetical protein